MGSKQSLVRRSYLLGAVLIFAACGKRPASVVFKPLKTIPHELVSARVELEVLGSTSSIPSEARLRKFKLERPQFIPLKNGKFLANMVQGQILSLYNRPRIPFLKYAFQVPQGQEAQLKLVAPELEQSQQSVSLATTPKPLVWGKQNFVWKDTAPPAYYPGKLFEAHQVGQQVFVTLYPVQVEMETGKVLTLVRGNWKVSLKPKPRASQVAGNTPAIILTSSELLDGAKELQRFHQNALKMESEIVTIESIAKNEKPIALEELPEGYKTPEGFEGIIKSYDAKEKSGYDFETARKIISYLRRRTEKSDLLKYLVVLGDSEQVPPSYYFQERLGGMVTRGVTDQCYGAGKECLEARLAVGRLPLKNLDEVKKYLKKASDWLNKRNAVTSDLSLYGGRAFKSSPLYIGELGTLETLNLPGADWNGVHKFFETEGNFKREILEQNFSGKEKSALVYYLDHGLGNRLFAGDESVSSNDILKMDSLPENPEGENAPPVVVSVACINAAFDEALLLDDTLEDQDEYGKISVGTALVKSRLGAIAYLGGSRDGLGSPETEVDEKGNVKVLGTSHGLQLLDGFIEKHRTLVNGRLGDALMGALSSYAHEQGNDMTEFSHRYTYWITELLGDPLMPLPKHQGGQSVFPPAQSDFDGFEEGEGFPQLVLEKVVKEDKKFTITSSESSVTAKLYELELGAEGYSGQKLVKSLSQLKVGKTSLPIEFEKDLLEGKSYLIKLTNNQGVPREQHVVFSSRP